MERRWLAVLGLVLAVGLMAAPASAHDFTGHEEDEQDLTCPGPEGVPPNQEPPGDGECDEPGETTYRGYVWDNDVKCASGGTATPVANIYATGDPTAMEGGVGLCNDGSGALPAQGRVSAYGSEDMGGIAVTADGDKDNSAEQAQGFAQVFVGPSGPTVRCGDANGRQDASHIGPQDGQEDCG